MPQMINSIFFKGCLSALHTTINLVRYIGQILESFEQEQRIQTINKGLKINEAVSNRRRITRYEVWRLGLMCVTRHFLFLLLPHYFK